MAMRVFKCLVCGAVMYAPKKQRTSKGHLKDMWCWKCKQERKFIQIG